MALMNRREAANYLGKSARSVATYVAEGKLKQSLIKGRTGMEAFFEEADLERFKRELETPLVRVAPEPGTLVPVESANSLAPLAAAFAAALRTALPSPESAEVTRETYLAEKRARWPWLTLADAAQQSGLPKSYLLRRALAGAEFAINLSEPGKRANWRVNIEWLVKL
jgi:hypothetical protein